MLYNMDHINTLPDEVLNNILALFSYKNQYILGVVCHRWYNHVHMVNIDYTVKWTILGSPIDDMLYEWKYLRGTMLTCMMVSTFRELAQPIAKYRFMTDSIFCRTIQHYCNRYYGQDKNVDQYICQFYQIFDGQSAPGGSNLFSCCTIL